MQRIIHVNFSSHDLKKGGTMPYITAERREQLHAFFGPTSPGDLNFLLTELCVAYFKNNGGRYQQINDVVGALECCKLEFYRRIAEDYEDNKKWENGDVYA